MSFTKFRHKSITPVWQTDDAPKRLLDERNAYMCYDLVCVCVCGRECARHRFYGIFTLLIDIPGEFIGSTMHQREFQRENGQRIIIESD